jgi:hypothetical protein
MRHSNGFQEAWDSLGTGPNSFIITREASGNSWMKRENVKEMLTVG